MANLISSSFDLVSSLQPPDADGLKAEDLAKRWLELQSRSEWLKVENERLVAHNLVLEERCRGHLRALEDKEEVIIRLKEEAVSMSGTGGRWKDKYERVQEEYEIGERKWRAELGKAEEKNRHLEVEMKKLEIDLVAAWRAAEGGGETVEKMKAEVERLKRLVGGKDGAIAVLTRKNEALEREKMKMEKELGDRVIKLEGSVAKWVGMEDNSCSVQAKGNGYFKDSGEKAVGKSLIEPKKESLVKEIDVRHDKELDAKVLGIGKEVSSAQKLTDPPIVLLSDDEEEESYCNELKTKMASSEDSSGATGQPTPKAINSLIHNGTTKNAPCVASPLTGKGRENIAVSQKRKSEAVVYSAERPSESKRSKSDGSKDGKTWENSGKMFCAFTTNVELCMKSVCALYRKHKSLGVWKNPSDGNSVLKPEHEKSIVELGKFLTDGDPEGRMKKSLAELKRYPSGVELCREYSRSYCNVLFEIYSSNRDPLF